MSIEAEIEAFVGEVKTAVTDGVEWVEGETKDAMSFIFGVAAPIVAASKPTVVSGVLQAQIAFLSRASQDVLDGDLADLEQAFLEDLEVSGSDLLADAQSLGSNILQSLAGLAKQKLASAAAPPAAA